MITISVCMIVKNEEKVLSRCLESLKCIADEIIIVDTGSSDATKEIAARYTDKVYDFEWIYDFSAARNLSFSKATMDYIYVADADEVIDEDNIQKFLLLKEKMVKEIDIVQMIYANQLLYNTTYNFDEEHRPKLYKRLRTFRWEEPIHESVVITPVIYDSDIVIKHLPTSNHADRDFDNFQRVIKKQGQLSPKLYEMYARELYISGQASDFEQAFDFFLKFATEEGGSERERKICECILVKCYRIRSDINGMMKYALHNIADGKGSSEVCYELGEYFSELGDYIEATIWYYNAAFETECELNIHYCGDFPLKRLAECYHALGNVQQEKAFIEQYRKWNSESGGDGFDI